MKALVCHKFGPLESHKVRAWPDPKLGSADVLVDIAYAGVNFPDTLMVQGLYQVKPKLPFVPGHECSGIIREVGSDVKYLKPGDRVFVSTGTFGIAEQIVVKWPYAKKLPDTVPLDMGACLSVTYGTTLHALKDVAQLQEDETILVLGASGGTGSAAIEIAKVMGATVIAAASSQEKLDYCKELGADYTINYTDEDLRDRIKEITQSKGVDVVFDPVGDKYAEPALRSLGWQGRYCVVGFAAGQIPKLPLNLVLLSERKILGVENKAWSMRNPQEHNTILNMLANWAGAGKLKPKITARFPLENSVEALQYAQSRQGIGKIVIEVDTKLT